MKKNVLIVEDDETLAEGLKIILTDEGYSVFVMNDGRQINLQIKENIPDIILMDYLLPGEDGGILTKRLKSAAPTSQIPIIMMSASQRSMQKIARDFGANAFLSKPFEIEDLLLLVRNFLSAPSI